MVKTVSLLLLVFLMGACSSKSLSPAMVSQEFWEAQRDNKIETAQKLTVKEDTQKTTLYKKIQIKTAKFGEAIEKENRATVPTTLYLKNDSHIDKVEFPTTLSNTDKGWRINMDKTKKDLYFAISKQVVGNFGTIVKEGLGDVEKVKNLFGEFIETFKETIEHNSNK
ncbi:MAG: hypothetical protein K0U47_08175 [Epsilonproteobacteria bacterium]|nr:hypothetical protein [Campylobacterota bacterium]